MTLACLLLEVNLPTVGRMIPFLVLGFGAKTLRHAPVPCHFAGMFRLLFSALYANPGYEVRAGASSRAVVPILQNGMAPNNGRESTRVYRAIPLSLVSHSR